MRRDSSGAGVVSRWISFEGQTGKRREKSPIPLPHPPSPPFLSVTGLLILDAPSPPPPHLHFSTPPPSVPHTSPCSPRGSEVTPLAPLVYTSVHVRFILSDLRFATAPLYPSLPPPPFHSRHHTPAPYTPPRKTGHGQ